MSRLAIVTCFFNFAGFLRPQANLRRFLRQMKREGVAVYGVEAHRQGQDPITKEEPGWTHVVYNPENQILWQKETLLNLAAETVPAEYDVLAWVDCDVWFDNPDWQGATLRALEHQDVVQMFRVAVWTDRAGQKSQEMNCSAAVGLDARWRSHPGFAWAMRRELWRKAGGLYHFDVVGGGDTMMTLAFMGLPLWNPVRSCLGSNPCPYEAWRNAFVGCRTGFVPGVCYHEWHGDIKDRGYANRYGPIIDLDVSTGVRIGANGMLEWTCHAHPLKVAAVKAYFAARKEDGG